MQSSGSRAKWLETAYYLFATEGPDKFTVKALAESSGLPRTNFYYHFDNKEQIIDRVIELHFETVAQLFNEELASRLHTFIPDLYEILFEFKLGLQFAKQLFRHREIPKYNDAHVRGQLLSAELIVPKFKEFFHIDLPKKEALALWCTLVDAWYSRLSFDRFEVEVLIASCYDVMDTLLPLIRKTDDKPSDSNHSTPVSK